MNCSEPIAASSSFKASYAYIEKHDAASLSFAPGTTLVLRLSPSRRLTLSIISIHRNLDFLLSVTALLGSQQMPFLTDSRLPHVQCLCKRRIVKAVSGEKGENTVRSQARWCLTGGFFMKIWGGLDCKPGRIKRKIWIRIGSSAFI